jgi:hypothetical protein
MYRIYRDDRKAGPDVYISHAVNYSILPLQAVHASTIFALRIICKFKIY